MVTLCCELLLDERAELLSLSEEPPNTDRMPDQILLKKPRLVVVVVGDGVVVVVKVDGVVDGGGEPGACRH